MKTITLVRHAKSSWNYPGLSGAAGLMQMIHDLNPETDWVTIVGHSPEITELMGRISAVQVPQMGLADGIVRQLYEKHRPSVH